MLKKILTTIALAVAMALVPAIGATATGSHNVELWWAMPDGGTPSNVTWPQTHEPDPTALTCNVWYQVDTVPESEAPALTADGMLTNGEDHGIVISWRFVYGGDCAPPPTATPVQPTAEAGIETCVGGESQDALGTITLPEFEGGHWVEATGTLTGIAPGEYAFTAAADPPHVLTPNLVDGVETDMWFVTVPQSVDVDCTVPVDPPVDEEFPPPLPLDEDLPTLASTGPSDLIPLGMFTAALLSAAGIILIRRTNRVLS